jgi:hypothetical protein
MINPAEISLKAVAERSQRNHAPRLLPACRRRAGTATGTAQVQAPNETPEMVKYRSEDRETFRVESLSTYQSSKPIKR